MEVSLALLMLFAAPVFLAIFAMGVAQGHGRSKLEDMAQYEHFNPTVRPVLEVDRKKPTSVQTTDTSVTVAKNPEKAASSHDLGKRKFVHGVMEKPAYYCFENQSVDEALRIMREHGLQYLPVVDSNLRVVGMVRRHY